jgi:hypothetical protein
LGEWIEARHKADALKPQEATAAALVDQNSSQKP